MVFKIFLLTVFAIGLNACSSSAKKQTLAQNSASPSKPLAPEIRKHLQKKFSRKVSGCYDKILKKKIAKEGKMTLQWKITPQGQVLDPVVKQDSVGSRFLQRCLVYHLKKLRFEPLGKKEITVAELPLLFKMK